VRKTKKPEWWSGIDRAEGEDRSRIMGKRKWERKIKERERGWWKRVVSSRKKGENVVVN
jgi:hypothetical protein